MQNLPPNAIEYATHARAISRSSNFWKQASSKLHSEKDVAVRPFLGRFLPAIILAMTVGPDELRLLDLVEPSLNRFESLGNLL
jgi:hypothetical protein